MNHSKMVTTRRRKQKAKKLLARTTKRAKKLENLDHKRDAGNAKGAPAAAS